MKDCIFTLVNGKRSLENKDKYPLIIKETYQVFECTWVDSLDGAENDKVLDEYFEPFHSFNGITSKNGVHFILKIDNILIKPKHYDAIINGVKVVLFHLFLLIMVIVIIKIFGIQNKKEQKKSLYLNLKL